MNKSVVCCVDREGKIMRVSGNAKKMLPFGAEEMVGEPFSAFFRPERPGQAFSESFFQNLSPGPVFFNGLYKGEQGGFHTLEWTIYSSKPASFSVCIGKKQVVRPVQEAEALPPPAKASFPFPSKDELFKVIEDMAEAFITLDRTFTYTYLNKEALQLLGKQREELLGKNIWELFPQWIGTSFYNACFEALEKRDLIVCEEYIPGLNKWFNCRIFPQNEGLMVFFQEITSRKTAEAALEKSEKLYRSIFASHPEAVFVTDKKGFIQKLNEVAVFKFANRHERLEGANILNFLSAESRGKMSTALPLVLAGKSMQLEGWVVAVENAFLATITLIPIRLENTLTGFFIKFRDITQKFQQEKELSLLNEVSLGLSAAPTLEEGLEGVMGTLCRYTGFDYGEFWMPLFGQDLIKMKSHWIGDPFLESFFEGSRLRVYEMEKDLPAALKNKKVIFSNSIQEEKGFRRQELARQHNLCSYLVIPVEYRGTYLGTFALFGKKVIQPNSFSPHSLQNLLNKLGGEIERRRSSEELDKFFKLSPDLLCIIGFDGYFKKTNPAFLEILGYTTEEIHSMHVLDLVHPDDFTKVSKALQETYNGFTIRTLESRYCCKDGSYRWIATTEEAVPEDSLLYVVGRDITWQKQQIAEIEQIRTGIESSSDGLCIGRGLQELTYVNKAFHKLLGLDVAAINQRGGPISLFNDSKTVQEVHCSLVEKGRWEGDAQILDNKGEIRDFNIRCNLIQDEQGDIKFFVGLFTDVSEQKKIQGELHKLNKAVEGSSNEVYIVNTETYKFTYANKRGLENSGYSLQELKEMTPTDLNPELTTAEGSRFFSTLGDGNVKSQAIKSSHQRKNGSWYPVEAHLSVFSHEGSRSAMLQVIDISERVKTEEALYSMNERYKLAAKATSDAIWDWDLTTNTVFWGDGFHTLFGHSFSENSGAVNWELNIHPEDAKRAIEKIFQVLHSGQHQWVSEYRFKCSDGSYKHVRDRAYVMYDPSGKALRMTGAVTDISDQKKNEELLLRFTAELEEQVRKKTDSLQRSLKKIKKEMTARALVEQSLQHSLEEKEVLLKEIHHRVKNNMAIVSGLLTLQVRHAKLPEVKALFKDSQRRIKSMALIHELLYQNENLSKINFRNYIHELVDGLSSSFQQQETLIDIEIKADDTIELDIVQAVPCGLILNELITNSFKYAFIGKAEGRIAITFCKMAEGLLLEVADNGLGLPAAFEPNYRKTLGMQLVANLVKQIGGQLTIGARQEGASFKIIFNKTVKQHEQSTFTHPINQ